MNTAFLHFHGELARLSGQTRAGFDASRRASVKDALEAHGVPHTEVYGLEAGGQAIGFGHIPKAGEIVGAFPGATPVDMTAPCRLREPLPRVAFLADVNVGRLATYLRLLGVDTAWVNGLDDPGVTELAARERRVVLTRDRGLLKRKAVEWGRLVTANDPVEQTRGVVAFFGLAGIARPFTLCVRCNAALEAVSKEEVMDRLEPRTRRYYQEFHRCPRCSRVYWAGSHHEKMAGMAQRLMR